MRQIGSFLQFFGDTKYNYKTTTYRNLLSYQQSLLRNLTDLRIYTPPRKLHPMSNEKNPGCLVYIGGYTTQLYRD